MDIIRELDEPPATRKVILTIVSVWAFGILMSLGALGLGVWMVVFILQSMGVI